MKSTSVCVWKDSQFINGAKSLYQIMVATKAQCLKAAHKLNKIELHFALSFNHQSTLNLIKSRILDNFAWELLNTTSFRQIQRVQITEKKSKSH